MKDKKGFIAISLLYAFFLIFIMLMVGILATTTQNRILVGALKGNIRKSIDNSINDTLLFDTIKVGQEYKVGEKQLFGGETWFVIEDSLPANKTVKLVLARVLTQEELKSSLGVTKVQANGQGTPYEPSELLDFYMLEGGTYKIRGCRNPSKHNSNNQSSEFCFRYAASETPLASYTIATDTNAGTEGTQYQAPTYKLKYPFIPQKVVSRWFENHPMLRRLKTRIQTSTIGDFTNLYARLPYAAEVTSLSNHHEDYESDNEWHEDWIRDLYPFHLADGMTAKSIKVATLNNLTDTFYSAHDAPSYYGAYIRPVVEVKKAK